MPTTLDDLAQEVRLLRGELSDAVIAAQPPDITIINPPPGGGTTGDVYVGSCHFGRSQCYMDLDTTQTVAQQYADLRIPATGQERVELAPQGADGHYYARLTTRIAVTQAGVTYMNAAIGQFVGAGTGGGSPQFQNVVAGSTLQSTSTFDTTTHMALQTPWLLLDLFATHATFGGYVGLLTWTDDPYQGYMASAEITVVKRPGVTA